MNKNEFLSILADGLKDFPEKELADIIFDYQEHFTIGLSNGKTEHEIIDELGNPYEIVNQYRNAYLEKISNLDDEFNNTSDDYHYTKDNNNFYKEVDYEIVDTDDNTKTGSNDNTSKDSNDNKTFKKHNLTSKSILKIVLIVILCIIFSPLIIGAGCALIGIFIGIIGMFIGLICGGFAFTVGGLIVILSKLGLVVIGASNIPRFITEFPDSVLVLFTIGSIAITILFIMLIYYFLKWLIISLISLFKKLIKGDN
ncbi:HAAS domain-containing protein [Eubacterium multiforme]|uniref:Membrane protein n=1 Tax=Eubacterium multiforme TaxID=83339 RepID=A0ABT9UT44_9FIRM|nr:DUF1700 domain-containing protein [Eubacterium multiforme]MDQ0149479.1 putative membrane protein [Eubacterium multiforme]